jgi:SNF2 family DNA or RNA helicase
LDPIPSSPLIGESPKRTSQAHLAPWRVTAYFLPVEEIVDILSASMGRQVLSPGVVVGPDLTWWTHAFRYAGSLVARQQYLPGLTAEANGFRATWMPVFPPDDTGRVANLARQMPAVAGTLSPYKAASPPQNLPRGLLESFVAVLVDHLVRSSLARGPMAIPARSVAEASWRASGSDETPARAARPTAPAFDSAHDAWLHALQTPDGLIPGDTPALHELVEQIREWSRPVTIPSTVPFRLCFRIEEPQETAAASPGRGTDENLGAPESPERGACGDLGTAGSPVGRAGEGAGASGSPGGRAAGNSKTAQHLEAARWTVHYLLQPHDDPSLHVPVERAWGSRRLPSPFKGRESAIREYVLSALGQASSISPPIAAGLAASNLSGCTLDAAGAYNFLSETAGALEQAGFGVMLPAWWTQRDRRARLALRAIVSSPKMRSVSGLSLDEIIRFDWEVALGGQRLTLRELEQLARMKSPLVRLRGQWVEVRPAEIQAAIEFWKNRSSGHSTVRELVHMALGSTGGAGVPIEGVEADGWIGTLLDRLKGDVGFEEVAASSSFCGSLRPYQVRGVSWLQFLRQWGFGACLADDMGLGKTVQTLAFIQRNWNVENGRPFLIVCPTSVVSNWSKEASRFTPDVSVLTHHGIGRAKGSTFRKEAAKHAVVVSSYSLLHRDIEHLAPVEWAGVILDEAQNVKNPETKQARAARALKAECRIALTGTPVENHVGDLWSIMEFLNPGLLGTQAEFKRRFLIPIQAGHDARAAERLRSMSGPFILRRLKSDPSIVPDLPEKMEMKVFCTLTREQASLYAGVLKETESAMREAGGIQRKGLILATLSKLKQVCNHPAQFLRDHSAVANRSGKLARLTEMLEEVLEMNERALVFTQFAEMGALLQGHLQDSFGREVLFLHGQVTKAGRDRMIDRFQDGASGPPIFVLSLKAGGTGLNLIRASHVFHFDRWWNPAVENQATDRAFRIGQTRNVQVHKFICAGTLEEKIDEMIERKKGLADRIVGAGERWLTELSDKELRDVFALRKEAVGD